MRSEKSDMCEKYSNHIQQSIFGNTEGLDSSTKPQWAPRDFVSQARMVEFRGLTVALWCPDTRHGRSKPSLTSCT